MLFRKFRIEDVINNIFTIQVATVIDAMPFEAVSKDNLDQTIAGFLEPFKMMVPVFTGEIRVDELTEAKGAEDLSIFVYLPFTGDAHLFDCHGDSYPSLEMDIRVVQNEVIIPIRIRREHIESQLRRMVESKREHIQSGLDNLADMMRRNLAHVELAGERRCQCLGIGFLIEP